MAVAVEQAASCAAASADSMSVAAEVAVLAPSSPSPFRPPVAEEERELPAYEASVIQFELEAPAQKTKIDSCHPWKI
jgi:hypothetical protein